MGANNRDPKTLSEPMSTAVVISADQMGRGDDALGQVLVRNYLHTMHEVTPLPEHLVFLNSGVKLAVDGSPALDDLRALADQGVKILLCGTCLNHFELKDAVKVGEISNMYTISETMTSADKVINL